ncbi:programmed cell death protein 2-like isoform X3 [Ostrea edulis]|uniref:programmed cell death protein 2-like isoform X3 n=1 Tax=Ostrea edulis TaxID=37623 RepID=UPI0024AFABD5|nr:programmed cell death protein 2-like isoform X3 [Ostrea edulis]
MALLGLKDEQLDCSNVSWNVNKIGGVPDWMHPTCNIPKCPSCSTSMLLIVQLYCPLEGSPYHRTLYLFTCPKKQCWCKDESWCVLRSQSLDANYRKPSLPAKLAKEDMFATEDDWGEDVGDLGDFPMIRAGNVTEETAKSNSRTLGYSDALKCGTDVQHPPDTAFTEVAVTERALSNELDDLTIQDGGDEDITVDDHEKSADNENGDDEMVIPDDTLQNVMQQIENRQTTSSDMDEGITSDRLVSYYLSVIEEATLQAEEDTSHLNKLLSDYQRNEGVDLAGLLHSELPSSSGKDGIQSVGEKYERTEIKHGDKMFHRFRKQTALCPSQCVRYQWNGRPLYIRESSPSQKSTIDNKSCPSCGGPVVFELQLMPALVNFLQTSENAGPTTEFGTLIVFTCKNSCWDDLSKTRQECVHLQPDPDQHLFK